jgi:hypothetical protein
MDDEMEKGKKDHSIFVITVHVGAHWVEPTNCSKSFFIIKFWDVQSPLSYHKSSQFNVQTKLESSNQIYQNFLFTIIRLPSTNHIFQIARLNQIQLLL